MRASADFGHVALNPLLRCPIAKGRAQPLRRGSAAGTRVGVARPPDLLLGFLHPAHTRRKRSYRTLPPRGAEGRRDFFPMGGAPAEALVPRVSAAPGVAPSLGSSGRDNPECFGWVDLSPGHSPDLA